MMDGYVERRRAYIAEIRKSFDEPEQGSVQEETPANTTGMLLYAKIRLTIAIIILAGFLYMKTENITIANYEAADVIDFISENYYDTILAAD